MEFDEDSSKAKEPHSDKLSKQMWLYCQDNGTTLPSWLDIYTKDSEGQTHELFTGNYLSDLFGFLGVYSCQIYLIFIMVLNCVQFDIEPMDISIPWLLVIGITFVHGKEVTWQQKIKKKHSMVSPNFSKTQIGFI